MVSMKLNPNYWPSLYGQRTAPSAPVAPSFVNATMSAYTSSSGPTLSSPTMSANDCIVIGLIIGSGTPPALPSAIPSGFILQTDTSISSVGFAARFLTYIKITAGSETLSFTFPASYNYQGFVGSFSGVNTTTPMDAAATTYTYDTAPGAVVGTTQWQSITTATDNALLVGLSHCWGDTANDLSPPTGFTEIGDSTLNYAAYKAQASAGASGDFSHTNNNTAGGSRWQSATLALRPA